MSKLKQNPSSNNRLGNLILVDKKRLAQELSQSRDNVNTKEDIEATMDIFFAHLEGK
ncbi:unnamed protein product [marine sediment metagenome]|uniref:Uncharacterized protein n=1 Tax=marine sediment metagenome TaxID=412755 RepID=X1AR43_9ZZZZ